MTVTGGGMRTPSAWDYHASRQARIQFHPVRSPTAAGRTTTSISLSVPAPSAGPERSFGTTKFTPANSPDGIAISGVLTDQVAPASRRGTVASGRSPAAAFEVSRDSPCIDRIAERGRRPTRTGEAAIANLVRRGCPARLALAIAS